LHLVYYARLVIHDGVLAGVTGEARPLAARPRFAVAFASECPPVTFVDASGG
jgi:hypothetical protein